MALSDQQLAHGKEKVEALTENVRVLELLLAHKQGAITAMEFRAGPRRGARPGGEVEAGLMLSPSTPTLMPGEDAGRTSRRDAGRPRRGTAGVPLGCRYAPCDRVLGPEQTRIG
jgi:hypothetical protein